MTGSEQSPVVVTPGCVLDMFIAALRAGFTKEDLNDLITAAEAQFRVFERVREAAP